MVNEYNDSYKYNFMVTGCAVTNCRGSYIRLYVAKLKIVYLTLDTWWSLLHTVGYG